MFLGAGHEVAGGVFPKKTTRDMGVIDKGDSLAVTDVAPSDSAQIAADTAAVAR